jgi:hypothetical protein
MRCGHDFGVKRGQILLNPQELVVAEQAGCVVLQSLLNVFQSHGGCLLDGVTINQLWDIFFQHHF